MCGVQGYIPCNRDGRLASVQEAATRQVEHGNFMKKRFFHLPRAVTAMLSGAVLTTLTATAADAPAPTDNAPPPAQPQGQGRQGRGQGGGGNFQGGRANFGGGGIALDDKQRELLREANQVDIDELRKLNDQLQAAQKELVHAVVAEKYDERVVREKAELVSKIQTEITMLRAKALATVSPTLRPEQREQLENSRIGIGMIMGGAGGGFAGGPGGGGGFRNAGNPGDVPPPTDRAFRRNNNGGNGDPGQPRRRGGTAPGE